MRTATIIATLALGLGLGCGDKSGNNGASNNGGSNNGGSNNGGSNNGGTNNGGANNGGSNNGASDMGDNNGASDMAQNNGAPDMASNNGAVDMGTPDLGPPPDPLDGIGQAVLVQENFQFTEGPRWFPDEGVLRFTDIPANTIYEWDGAAVTEYRSQSAGANGLAFDAMGQFLAAEHGARQVSVTVGGQRQTLVAQYLGEDLNSPNDLAVHSGGWLYFTDPPYGLNNRPRGVDFNGLFRFTFADENLVAEWEGAQSTRPNGVALSPDEAVLYLADTAAGEVYAFDVGADGALTGQRDFATSPGADGLAVDTRGNLYVAASGGIAVFAPDGTSWGTISIPRQPANCGFGGSDATTLYVTARQGLYSVRMVVPGIY